MKQKAAFFIAFLLALSLAVPAARAEIAALPLEGGGLEVDESHYITDRLYEDPSIRVEIVEGNRLFDTNYIYALIRISTPAQLRTAMAVGYNSSRVRPGYKMAEENNAILAVNGDYFKHSNHHNGYMVRQGVLYRDRPHQLWELLLVDQHGDFHGIAEPERQKIEQWQQEHPELQVINSFNFGPILIRDGEIARDTFAHIHCQSYISGNKKTQRVAICQLDALTYLCVVCEGGYKSNKGMTLDEFAQCLKAIDEQLEEYTIRLGYNLDGGGSSQLLFHGEKLNMPANKKEDARQLSDIIYFASAWQADGAQ